MKFTGIRTKPPSEGDYLKVKYVWKGISRKRDVTNVYFILKLMFDRFYLEEGKARRIEEKFLRLRNRNSRIKEVYALVRVKRGYGVVEDLYLNGMPVCKFLEEVDKESRGYER